MEYVQFTDFRNNSKEYFDKIENGQSFIIIKRGKPVAQITPFTNTLKGWKREVKRIKLKNKHKTTTDYIIEERNEK